MNIKSVAPQNVIPIDPKQRVDTNVRSQSTTDRDGHGQRDAEEHEQKRHLTDQEFDDALKALSENPGLKSNHLILKVETHEDSRVVLIIDPDGKIVRRLSESQLWSASRSKDRQTGSILDKAM